MANETIYGRAGYDTVCPGDATISYRGRIASRQAEALEHWRIQLAEQSSALNSPAARIRIWERRHQIALPRDPEHRLIELIAANTGLSAEEVHAEQRFRAEAPEGAAVNAM